jgi:hypothetical protein
MVSTSYPQTNEAMRCSNNFKVCNHVTGNVAATSNDNFSQTRTIIHLQLNKTKPHYFGRKVKQAKNIMFVTQCPWKANGRGFTT